MTPPSQPGPLDGPETAALRDAVDQHSPAIYRLALGIVHDRSLADDVVQETMVKAWRKSPVAPGEPIPKAWLMRVARNTAISMLRSRREDVRSPETIPDGDDAASTTRQVEGRAQLNDLSEAMARLDADARTLIVLKEIDGLSYDDISAVLGLSVSAVKTRMFRARAELKKAMKDWQ